MRGLQALLLLAGAGAIVILLGLFGRGVAVAGLVAIVVATVLSAPRAPVRGWWGLLAAGAAISVIAAVVALAAETLGGLLAVIGGILVVIAASLGFPLADER